MSIEQERLLSLVEFAQQSARLRTTPASTITQHGVFALYEHQVQGLPGITLNAGNDGEDEIWLIVERRHETKPPEVKNALLQPWIEMTQGPAEEPKLKETTDGASLIASGPGRRTAYSTCSRESSCICTFFAYCSGVRICSRIAPS
jgi:hypothetical protein